MNAEIIAVGSELLLGQIANTNAQFLSSQLATLGINVYYHTTVGDNPSRLNKAIETAANRADVIIFTGGLGPTKDDLTKETIADYLDKELVENEFALERIKAYFERTNRTMSANNRKQALVLKGAEVFPNDNGMAPGMALKQKKQTFVLLPGPPREMKPMFKNYVSSFLSSQLSEQAVIASKVLHFFGIGEAQLETELEDLIDKQTNPTIAPLAADGEVVLRLTAKADNHKAAHELIKKTEDEILARVGEFFYGYDDTSLIRELLKTLQLQKVTVASAESLTGGMFAEWLTSQGGTSAIFKGGAVTYTNDAKSNVLGVSEETLETYGAVSEQAAKEMAEKVRSLFQADIGLSFTGVAGPTEQEGKPIGTVYIGIAQGDDTKVYELNLGGSREANRIRSVKYGCHYLLHLLKESK
ncbi:competence/damage-inducible protein A [Bacillus tianshenii]|nr:competence/damage-inducible protein A [Bacillus tianshenii]